MPHAKQRLRHLGCGQRCNQTGEVTKRATVCLMLLPLRLALLFAVLLVVSVAGCCILVLDAATCGCRCCVAQARLDESRHGEQSVRCRIGQPSRAVDRLQPSLPRRLFLFATRPLLRLALFFSGFHWVRAPPAPPREHASPSAPTPRGPSQVRGRDMPGYSYDAQACVVANQGGLLELLYLLWLIAPGTVVADMCQYSVLVLPALTALGVVDVGVLTAEGGAWLSQRLTPTKWFFLTARSSWWNLSAECRRPGQPWPG